VSRPRPEREVFARTMLALQPYAAEVVLIGGWVHALYIADSSSLARAVHTTDIDVTLPPSLATAGRPTLIELVQNAGFEIDELDSEAGAVRLSQLGEGGEVIDLDLLTDAHDPRVLVQIEGQPGLCVAGYPDQHVLLESARWIEVGPDIHSLLDPPLRIRVPTLGAYVLVKALSSRRRPGERKRAKDLVYLFEIVRDGAMREQVIAEMPGLALRYPAEYAAWRAILAAAAGDGALLERVAEQLLEQVRAIGSPAQVARHVGAYLRRVLGETPP
jgi:hypothetical protein